jgi:hypothetical protein
MQSDNLINGEVEIEEILHTGEEPNLLNFSIIHLNLNDQTTIVDQSFMKSLEKTEERKKYKTVKLKPKVKWFKYINGLYSKETNDLTILFIKTMPILIDKILSEIKINKDDNEEVLTIFKECYELIQEYNKENVTDKIYVDVTAIDKLKYNEDNFYFRVLLYIKYSNNPYITTTILVLKKIIVSRKFYDLECNIVDVEISYEVKDVSPFVISENITKKLENIKIKEIDIDNNNNNKNPELEEKIINGEKTIILNKSLNIKNPNSCFFIEGKKSSVHNMRLFFANLFREDIEYNDENRKESYAYCWYGKKKLDPTQHVCQNKNCQSEKMYGILRLYFFQKEHNCKIHLCEICLESYKNKNLLLPCLSCKDYSVNYSKTNLRYSNK